MVDGKLKDFLKILASKVGCAMSGEVTNLSIRVIIVPSLLKKLHYFIKFSWEFRGHNLQEDNIGSLVFVRPRLPQENR